jgi:hypothetical protein
MSKEVVYTTRLLEGWMTGIITAISVLLSKETSLDSFYRFGPSDTLVVIGLKINTYSIYACVLIYCFINTCIRNLNNQIVAPWITNVIHDTTVSKDHLSRTLIYEIVTISAVYTWVDWFIYINLLFAQIDMVIVEICTELIVTGFVTRMYLAIPVDLVSTPLINRT